jgi:hypothetical protein
MHRRRGFNEQRSDVPFLWIQHTLPHVECAICDWRALAEFGKVLSARLEIG